MNKQINILITSGRSEDRQRIISSLPGNDFIIAGTESDEVGAIIRTERLKPDVLIFDLKSSLIDYPELTRIIHRRSPSTAIIIFSRKEEYNLSCLVLKTKISGILLKEEDIDILALIVKLVFFGRNYINTSIFSVIIEEMAQQNRFMEQVVKNSAMLFSPVECGIVTDLANGLSDDQIAEHLNYSEGSIKNILCALKRRTKLKNRIQIVVFALFSGLVNFEDLWMNKE